MCLRNFKTIKERRLYLEKIKKVSLKGIGIYPEDLEKASFRNCENMIGAMQVPLGIAGPLKIIGKKSTGEYYLPLATTEGALIASVNRGCKAIGLSGGALVYSEYIGITRGAVFAIKGINEGLELKRWLESHSSLLSQTAQKTSSHLKLKKIETKIIGRNVFTRFYFDSVDAMGMNMVTIAVTEIAKIIKEKTGIIPLAVAGNFDIDKKPAWLNFILGRGRQVWAEAILPNRVIKEILKTTPEKIHEVVISKCYLGSMMSGSLGFNAQFANIIAAFFIACGQDVAHVVEGSLGITTTQLIDKDLYISIFLPDLIMGTVGGGTSLPSQSEALKLLGVFGGREGENATVFAEIIAGAVLVGEISLLASLAEGSLAAAHKKLARGKEE